jgi:multicomponent Na+:H+ antiporter subunit D
MDMIETLHENLPLLVTMSTLLGAYLMPVVSRVRFNLSGPLAVVSIAVSFCLSLYFIGVTRDGTRVYYNVGHWPPPWGIRIAIDPMTAFIVTLVSGVGLVVLFYALREIKESMSRTSQGWYITTYLLLMSGMLGMAVTDDLFNLYVFIEVTGFSAVALVAARDDQASTEAAFKYLMLATLGSGFIMAGIGMVYVVTGHLNMRYVTTALITARDSYPMLLWVALSFFVAGFGVKSALFPLHVWLPDAYSSAPSPSSAILSGLVSKVYIFGLIKVLYFCFYHVILARYFIPTTLTSLACAGIIGGSLFAMIQPDIKRRLAYSSVAQIGYIYLALGLNTRLGMVAALFHIMSHAIMKSCLFMAAGGVTYRTGRRSIRDFAGLGKAMPWTMACFTICSFSMMGIPLLSGFVSKWYLLSGSLDAGSPFMVVIILVGSLLAAAYLLPVVWRAWFTTDESGAFQGPVRETPWPMLVPILLLTGATILLGIKPALALDIIEKAVETLFF